MPQLTEVGMDDLYASLDVETLIVVQQRTSEIKTLMRRTAQDIIEIGQKLIEVNAQLGHGLFSAWLRIEFEWSRGTAENFMAVALRFQDQKISDFDVAPSTLYMLASPSTPESARKEALKRAEQGERITHSVAQQIVAAHRMAPVLLQGEEVIGGGEANEEDSQLVGQDHAATQHQQSRPAIQVWGTTPQLAPTAEAVEPAPAAANHKLAVHFSSRTAEHYMPESIITSTVIRLGEIDLDPCSDGGDPPNVPAQTHCTAAGDGLAHPWHGCIYMNPPCGREIGDWLENLYSEYEAKRVTEAIALLPSRADTQWWKRLREYPFTISPATT